MYQAAESAGDCRPLTTFLWMLQSETTHQSPLVPVIPTRKAYEPESSKEPEELLNKAHSCVLNLAWGCFYVSCMCWRGRCCSLPAFIPSICKHTVTGQPLTICFEVYSSSNGNRDYNTGYRYMYIEINHILLTFSHFVTFFHNHRWTILSFWVNPSNWCSDVMEGK